MFTNRKHMNKKLFAYVLLPVVSFSILGAGIASANGWGWFGGSYNTDPTQFASQQQTMFQQRAQLLGVTIDEIKNAWAQGKTISQLAQEKGISQADLQKRATDLRTQQLKDKMQVLVSQGVVTQAQADARLQFMQTQSANKKGMGFLGLGFHSGNKTKE